MTRRRKSDRELSWNLFLLLTAIFLVLAVLAVHRFKSEQTSGGFEALGYAILVLAIDLMFALPSRCRVATSRHQPCHNQAYGLLFGCLRDHFWTKLFVRLGLQREAVKRVGSGKGSQRAAVRLGDHGTSNGEAVRVSIEATPIERCAVWIGAISGLLGIAATLTGVLKHV